MRGTVRKVVDALRKGTGTCTLALLLCGASGRVFNFSAGRTEVRREEGGWVKVFEDGFRATDGTVLLSAERGAYREGQAEVVLEGEVVVEDTAASLRAGKVVYRMDEEVVEASGKVMVVYRGWKFRAGEAKYFRREGYIVADGGVALEDTSGEISARALRGRYEFEGKGYIEKEAVLTRTGALLSADRISSDGRRMVAEGNVLIKKGNMEATCGRAEYRGGNMLLTVGPSGYISEGEIESTLKGDTIEVFLRDLEVERLVLSGGAQLSSRGPEGSNLLSGRKIEVFLEGNEPKRILVLGNAVG
ncbi:MAG TPA: hypothetical protein EYP61_02910, partial [Candidatus Latescibacteria bacterium]|nr:hypothetical protein [Candidatus Latescibacterota bacterium]